MFSTLSLYDVTERSDIKYYHRGKAELFCLQEAASQKKFGLNVKGRENKDRV